MQLEFKTLIGWHRLADGLSKKPRQWQEGFWDCMAEWFTPQDVADLRTGFNLLSLISDPHNLDAAQMVYRACEEDNDDG